MKHPREMTTAELEALAACGRVLRVELTFHDRWGLPWDVGQVGGAWMKSPNMDRASIAPSEAAWREEACRLRRGDLPAGNRRAPGGNQQA